MSDKEYDSDGPGDAFSISTYGSNDRKLSTSSNESSNYDVPIPQATVIKITLFQCKNGLSISDIEFNEDDIESLNEINIDQLDTKIIEEKGIFMNNEPIKKHEQIMPIYLILSNPPQIKVGNVINITNTDKNSINPELITAEPMIYAFYNLNIFKANSDLCISHFNIHAFESILYTSEFLKIIKCLIVLKELVKRFFKHTKGVKDGKKKKNEHITNDTVDIPIDKDKINDILNEIIQDHNSIIHINDIRLLKTLIKKDFEKRFGKDEYNKHVMTEELLKLFYHTIRQELGLEYVQKTITELGIDKIDNFSDKIYKNPEQILTTALNVKKYEKIQNKIYIDMMTKMNPKNPTDYENNLKDINDKITKKQIDQDKSLSLTKNYYVILFIMTYLKRQYEIYIDYIHKTKSINEKMKIELLNTMVGKLQETMTNIIAEFEKSLSTFTNNSELESHYDTLESEYRVFEPELDTVKKEANKLYNNYQRTKGGKSRRKREKNEGKYSRKGNRKI